MKKRFFSITKILMALLLLQTTACSVQKKAMKQQKHFTILGLGDSITEGGPDFFSYLFPLDSLLEKNGYHANFIGPRSAAMHGDTLHHSGFSGKTAEFLAKSIDSIYNLYPADMVLLHSGHNHFEEEKPVNSIIQAQQKIIQIIKGKNPGVTIFVAAVISSGKLPKYSYISELNLAIKNMVSSMHDVSVIFVDQQQHWDWNIHTISDKVHPNQSGAAVIAANWFDAMIKVLDKKQ